MNPQTGTRPQRSVWRAGRKLGRTLYRDEQCVGIVDSPEIAEQIVAALNNAQPEETP